jgi:hypothetical protein
MGIRAGRKGCVEEYLCDEFDWEVGPDGWREWERRGWRGKWVVLQGGGYVPQW